MEVREPFDANKESKYVELVMVVDNRVYRERGRNKNEVLNYVKDITNIINGVSIYLFL